MKTTLEKMIGKPTDYKICVDCYLANWYENNECYNCECSKFLDDQDDVLEWVKKEYDFWINVEDYTEKEADNIEIDI